MVAFLTNAEPDSSKSCASLETEFEGSFEDCIESALDGILEAGGGSLTVHRDLPVEHVNSDSCPCRPLLFQGGTSRGISDILAELETPTG